MAISCNHAPSGSVRTLTGLAREGKQEARAACPMGGLDSLKHDCLSKLLSPACHRMGRVQTYDQRTARGTRQTRRALGQRPTRRLCPSLECIAQKLTLGQSTKEEASATATALSTRRR